jgi:hypothetical protein
MNGSEGRRMSAPDDPSPGAAAPDFDALLARMRAGDRDAAAAFVTRYGTRIRRRLRGKMSPSIRRLFDSQELMSTVARRLDAFVRSGRLAAVSEGQPRPQSP